jgi:hypothetical protein
MRVLDGAARAQVGDQISAGVLCKAESWKQNYKCEDSYDFHCRSHFIFFSRQRMVCLILKRDLRFAVGRAARSEGTD